MSEANGIDSRPNVVLVMVDDMGYADISPYGGEIDTPNLQGLADNGLRFTQFYNYARCCPTRASLMTGLHPHQTGIGHMTNPPDPPEKNDRGVPNYRGHLNGQCVTLAEVLGDAGYHTLMAGKWHLGQHNDQDRPIQRGFDRYYGHLAGGVNYFAPSGGRGLSTGNDDPGSTDPQSTTDKRYYTTDAFTDYGIDFIEDALNADDDPFFLYLSYNAPHWPLHAHEAVVEKYRGEYSDGWDTLREQRYQRQIDMGLLESDWAPLSERVGPEWENLSEEKRAEMDERMAIYAAQIDIVDRNIGRLVDFLERRNELDETLFLFLSDNGACAEFDMLGSGPASKLNEASSPLVLSYGEAWAHASNTPFRKYKHWVHEGGAATPFIVHWPDGLDDPNGDFRRQPAYLPDIMASLVDVTGSEYPSSRDGIDIPTMEGTSLSPVFKDEPLDRDDPMFMEHEGNRFVRDGNWKLVSAGDREDYGRPDEWELFNMDADRTESTDLSTEFPEIVERLDDEWWKWAERVGVVPNGYGIETHEDYLAQVDADR